MASYKLRLEAVVLVELGEEFTSTITLMGVFRGRCGLLEWFLNNRGSNRGMHMRTLCSDFSGIACLLYRFLGDWYII